MRLHRYNFPAVVTTAICTAQTLAGAGAFTIDGTLLDLKATMQAVRRVKLVGIQRTITLTSTGNISGVNFTITGLDLRGIAVSEVIAGPNNNTVTTTAQFAQVDSVTANGAVATATSIGTGSTGVTNWFMTDRFKNPFAVTVACEVTATASWTVQDTPDDANDITVTPTAFNHPVLAAITASAESNYAFPARYIRGVMNSSSGSGAVVMVIEQAG